MKRNEWMSAAAVAVCTCLLSLAAFWPQPLTANEQVAPARPEMPKLTLEGVRIGIAAGEKALKAGEKIELQLTAVNETDQPREVTFDCTLMSPGEVSPMSRMPARPKEIWTKQLVLELEPGQTVTRTIETDQEANIKADYTAYLKAGQQQVAAWQHSGGMLALLNAAAQRQERVENARANPRAEQVAVNRARNGRP